MEENSCCPLQFGIDWTVVMCLRMHGERYTHANGDGRGGHPWRRSRPSSLKVYEVGGEEAVTNILWISTCQRPMAVLFVTWLYRLDDLTNGVGSGSVPSLMDLTYLP